MGHSTHKKCLYCNRELPFDNFPYYYRNYNLYGANNYYSYNKVCNKCIYDILLDRVILKVINGKVNVNDVNRHLCRCVNDAIKHNALVPIAKCSHLKPGVKVEYHHPDPHRFLFVIGLCKECHKKVSRCLRRRYKLTGIYPEHYVRNHKGKTSHTVSAATIAHKKNGYGGWGCGQELREYLIKAGFELLSKPSYTPVLVDKRRKEYRDANKKITTSSDVK